MHHRHSTTEKMKTIKHPVGGPQDGQGRAVMLPLVHAHMEKALHQQSKTDATMIVTAIVFDLIMLAVNSMVAGSAGQRARDHPNGPNDFYFYVFVLITLILNAITFSALNTSRESRNLLVDGLMRMYKDENVSMYFDARVMANYQKRYVHFEAVIFCLLVMSIVVPVGIRFMNYPY